MGFAQTMEIAASGLAAQRSRLEIISSNLANARTTKTPGGGPYIKKMVVFKAVSLNSSGSGSFSDQLKSELKMVKVERIFQDPNPPQKVFEPTHPDADASGYVLYPNINPIDEMVNMLGAARTYEANLEVLKTVKALGAVTLELAKV